MAGETANIAEVANKIAKDIFKWFRWESIPIMDENFPCHKVESHKKKPTKKTNPSYTHPVDTVFRYFDPYLNQYVYLNTDLKSYAKSSFKPAAFKIAIESLSKTIDCAASSVDWKKKYILDDANYSVRGLLFIYNWDNKYDGDIMGELQKLKLGEIPKSEDSIIHIFDPQRITYLYTVVKDIEGLIARKELSPEDYSFLYPDLVLHKAHGNKDKHPATIETLCSPFMILKHGSVFDYENRDGQLLRVEVNRAGYVIYYNEIGSTYEEFVYLFDVLSKLQILSSNNLIKFRVASPNYDSNIKSNFERAKNTYIADWGLDGHRQKDLDRIDFDIVPTAVSNYNPGILAWRYDD